MRRRAKLSEERPPTPVPDFDEDSTHEEDSDDGDDNDDDDDNENGGSDQNDDDVTDAQPAGHGRRTFLQRFWGNMSYLKYVILVLFLPPILNFGALQREAVVLVPKGEKVNIGWGQKMYIHCEGEGLPTVILDAPTGVSSDIWIFIQKELAHFTKVCIYDRSGIGSSDAIFSGVSSDDLKSENRQFIAQPSSLEQMTSDLYYLVRQGKSLPKPFILAGSEVGSLISRMYSLMNPKDVTAVVLIDPLVETLFDDSGEWKDYWYSKLLPSYQSLHLSAVLGLSRIALLIGWFQPFFFKSDVPADVLQRQKSLLCNPRHINSVFNEHLYMNASFTQMSSMWMFEEFPSNISVSVISRNYPAEFPSYLHEEWKKSQRFLVEKLHPGCRNTVIPESDFLKLYSQTKHIVSSVKFEIERWRKKKKKKTVGLRSESE